MVWDAWMHGNVYLMSCLAENWSPAAGNSNAHWEIGAAVPPLWRSCCKVAPNWRKLHWTEKTPATAGRTGCCQLLPEEFQHGPEGGKNLPRVTRLSGKDHILFYFINSLSMTKASEAIYIFLFCVYVCVSILLCSPGCTQTRRIPISAPPRAGTTVCTTSGLYFSWEWERGEFASNPYCFWFSKTAPHFFLSLLCIVHIFDKYYDGAC